MKTFVLLFMSSTLFGVAIAIAYWLVAHHEIVGTLLLGCMTAALAFAALYALVAERAAHLDGDQEQPSAPSAPGEDLGAFTIHSPYPILLALSCLFTLIGALYSPLLAVASLVALTFCLWRMGAESSRV
jgi:hypothetical protein